MGSRSVRRRTMDVFGEVEDTRPGELHAAQVQSNVDDFFASASPTSREKSKKKKRAPKQSIQQEPYGLSRAIKESLAHPVQATPPLDDSRNRSSAPSVSDESESMSIDSEIALDYEYPKTRASPQKSRKERGDMLAPMMFQLPKEGSYLHELKNNQPTSLMSETHSDSCESEDVPLRILSDFSVFHPTTLELLPLTCLWEGDGLCEAFGWAVPKPGEGEELDDRESIQDDGIPFRTSTILRYSPDIYQKDIYINTQYAWYILKSPASNYRSLFIPFYTQEMLFRLVLRSILQNPHISPEEFIQGLSAPIARDPFLDRYWTVDDLSKHCQYSMSELKDAVSNIPKEYDYWEDIKDAPLFALILRDSDIPEESDGWQETDDNASEPADIPHPRVRGARIPAPSRKHKQSKKIKTLPTTVTPIVHSLISQHFNIDFAVVGQPPSYLNESKLNREQPQILPGNKISYEAGDFVMVNEGDWTDESQLKFAQILFFDQRQKNFHARWFIHGSHTILEEFALGQELFLSVADDCRDVSADCLVRPCKVRRISLAQRATLKWPAKDTYFYSSAWDRKNPSDFIEVTDDQVKLPSSRNCHSCQARNAQPSHYHSRTISIIHHHEYHEHDFIRYPATNTTQLTCSIGQVIMFLDTEDGFQVQVRKLGRISERAGLNHLTEAELFFTPMEEILDASKVLGPCQVSHITSFAERLMDRTWLDQHPFNFYVQYQSLTMHAPLTSFPPANLSTCPTCNHKQTELEKLEAQCREKPLRAFDPFAGVGGFGLGLSRGCSMQTTLGVELNPSAAETMRRNFSSDTTVLTEDASRVLRRVVQGQTSGVPRAGQIDLIYSGPPCQNDSTLNMHKTDRKCLAFTALSYVDVLRPPLFIMESVPGFLRWKVQGTTHDVKAGDLKLVLKVLHFLGYNVMGRLMHARSYGVPQTRNRFFIVATLPGWGSFKFPVVTHAFKQEYNYKLQERIGSDLKLTAAVGHGCAPYKVVTIAEALSDLPLFDWSNPKKPTKRQKIEVASRARHIPTVSCRTDKDWGIEDADFKYKLPNVNAFQQRARWDMALCPEKIHQHLTKKFPSHMVQNVCDLPLALGADYRHLNQENREWALRDPASAQAIRGFQAGAYTRLDPDGYFHTIVTNVGPLAKQSSVVHPFCKRILTVRELARAQGFPDDFVFYSETDKIDDYHRQIGNSVPFGVAAALGRSIQDLVMKRVAGQVA